MENYKEIWENQKTFVDIDRRNAGISKACKELEQSLSFLLKKIKPQLTRQNIGGIVVDDGGGRTAGLLVKKVLDRFCTEHDLHKIPITFFSGSIKDNYLAADDTNKKDPFLHTKIAFENSPLLKELLSIKKHRQKLLIITDYIQSGKTTEAFKNYIKKHGVESITLSIGENEYKKKKFSFGPRKVHSYFKRAPLIDATANRSVAPYTADFGGVMKKPGSQLMQALRSGMQNKIGKNYDRYTTVNFRKKLSGIADAIYENLNK